MKFALLLDSGALIPLGSKIRTDEDARAALRSWKQSRRQMLERGDLVTPRLPLGLVRFKSGKAKGGHARAQALSPERRSEIAREAAYARWERERRLAAMFNQMRMHAPPPISMCYRCRNPIGDYGGRYGTECSCAEPSASPEAKV
jgi:hypothetical protein